MLGLYIHVPFCLSKCHYCDFYSQPAPAAAREVYLELLAREIEAAAQIVPTETVDSIYLGGGTPTVLGTTALVGILQKVRASFFLAGEVEISLETNPGLLPGDWGELAAAGLNRVSLGAQASQQQLLDSLGRRHNWQDVIETVAELCRAGLANLNLDLMYGLPGQTLALWQETVQAALRLEVPHLSLYALKVEENTAFAAWEKQGQLRLPEEEEYAEMYWWARERLEAEGYENYELSNFARPGWQCRHNLKYWRRQPYLGLGPSAHSCRGDERLANPASLEEWAAAVAARGWSGQLLEKLSPREVMAEEIILGLRLAEGVALSEEMASGWARELADLERKGLLVRQDNRIRLTRQAWYIASEVMAEFI